MAHTSWVKARLFSETRKPVAVAQQRKTVPLMSRLRERENSFASHVSLEGQLAVRCQRLEYGGRASEMKQPRIWRPHTEKLPSRHTWPRGPPGAGRLASSFHSTGNTSLFSPAGLDNYKIQQVLQSETGE